MNTQITQRCHEKKSLVLIIHSNPWSSAHNGGKKVKMLGTLTRANQVYVFYLYNNSTLRQGPSLII